MIIVKPLIIYVMMEKKYQLVAWTVNVSDNENGRLHMLPSLECEVQSDLVTDLTFIHKEEYKFDGPVSLDLARRAIRAYRRMSAFDILTCHYGDGIRYLFFAACYCLTEDGTLRKELRDEFIALCEEALSLADKYWREDILLEYKPKLALSQLR